MVQRLPDTLMVFIEPAGSVPFPAPFQEAAARFEEARIDYEQRHRFTEAARGFLAAARLLQRVEGFHTSNAAANRWSCYRNAWSAFSAAGKRAEGRAALSAAAQADPIHAGRIHELIGDTTQGPAAGKETMRPDVHVKDQLAAPFEPGGTVPVPPVFEQAQALYQQARAAYEANDYERAAADFTRAASVLRVPADQPYADTAASNRAVLYLDAAYAWRMAGRAEAGRATLQQLRADGVATDGDLRRALEALR